MNVWHDMNPKRITVDEFVAVIEIPKNSKVKYELNKETGLLEMDRILYTSTHYPANYGFIPRTYADDGDPLDVLVLCSQQLQPLTLVRCYPIGVIRMIDNEQRDDKIIAIPCNDPTYNSYRNIDICHAIFLRRSYISSRFTKSWNIRPQQWMRSKMSIRQRRLLPQTSTTISTVSVRDKIGSIRCKDLCAGMQQHRK